MSKLLIVDDNPSVTDMVRMAIEEEHEVLTAENARSGLRLAREEDPDLILLDVMMPDVGGYEMLRLLQGDAQTVRIPVIMITATKFDPSTRRMFEEEPNVSAFLAKPFSLAELRRRVSAALAGKGT